jgi:hypothetical protein
MNRSIEGAAMTVGWNHFGAGGRSFDTGLPALLRMRLLFEFNILPHPERPAKPAKSKDSDHEPLYRGCSQVGSSE